MQSVQVESHKDICIAVATHKAYRMPEDSMYLPLQVGKALHPDVDLDSPVTILATTSPIGTRTTRSSPACTGYGRIAMPSIRVWCIIGGISPR